MRILNSSSAGYLEIFFPLLGFASLVIYCLYLKMEAHFYILHLHIMNFQLHQRHLRLIFLKIPDHSSQGVYYVIIPYSTLGVYYLCSTSKVSTFYMLILQTKEEEEQDD